MMTAADWFETNSEQLKADFDRIHYHQDVVAFTAWCMKRYDKYLEGDD